MPCKRLRDVFPDAKSFIESWKNSRYDLLLLDCYLSDENLPHATTGLDIARLLRNQNDDCAIVFITSSTDFAVLGYEVQASGYLLKPVNRKTFEITHGTRRGAAEGKTAGHPSGKGAVARHGGFQPACGVRQLAVTMDRRLIAYALSNAHYVEFTFADGTQTKIRTNFSDVDRRLTVFDNFYRTARGVLVNFDYVSGITNAQFVMKGGKRIPITKTAVTTTCRAYAEYTFTRMRTED